MGIESLQIEGSKEENIITLPVHIELKSCMPLQICSTGLVSELIEKKPKLEMKS